MAKKVTLVYFSSTKTTKKNLLAMAEGMNCPFETVDFTLPASRERDVCFGEDDFVIFGSPVYGGVMPLLVREYLKSISVETILLALLWRFMETDISMIVWLRWKICSQKKVFW